MNRVKRKFFLVILFLLFTLSCNAMQRSVGGVLGGTPTNGQALLNEIRFTPKEGQPQFIELKNVGSGGAPLAGLELSNEAKQTYRLPDSRTVLAPGAFFLIVFDGQDKIDGLTLHADRTDFLNPTSGWVALAGKDGAPLDRVAWGDGQVGPVELSPGGIVQDPEPGMTIGRFPLATKTDPAEWVPFTPELATPGRVNPIPVVQILLPLSGALMAPEDVTLSWYPVAGATQYAVQVSQDITFTTLQIDQTVSVPTLKVSSLSAGTYYWRVQAIEADGSKAEFSPVNMITLKAPSASGHLFAPIPDNPLNVPFLFQKKDTPMLLLESKNETGPHAWDSAHPDFDRNDPADNKNCALASIAMVNHFYGGNLSQDRIGYYLLKDAKSGPERDLNYGSGFNSSQITRALQYALGVKPTLREDQSVDTFWKDVTTSIDAGRPMVGSTPEHAFVITGYGEMDDVSYITINDPWDKSYNVDIKNPKQSDLRAEWDDYWLIPSGVVATKDNPAIFEDSDGDGVVNIDESERFKTDPNIADTDQDGVNDKQDIASGVFDSRYGYAIHPYGEGRDIDGDGKPTEMDEDSDNGGCLDGMEDTNGNGKYEKDQGETDNFDHTDDMCINGSSELVFDFTCRQAVGSQVLTIREWGHNKGLFSVKSTDDGKLEGSARITASDVGIYYDMSSAFCSPAEWSSTKPIQWTAKLTGEYHKRSDGSIDVSIQATPENGPPMPMTTSSTCGLQLPPQQVESSYWTILPGLLVNGRFDDRLAVPLPSSCSGDAYFKTHMEAPPKFK